jgi:hypothetical protein
MSFGTTNVYLAHCISNDGRWNSIKYTKYPPSYEQIAIDAGFTPVVDYQVTFNGRSRCSRHLGEPAYVSDDHIHDVKRIVRDWEFIDSEAKFDKYMGSDL